MVRLRSITPHFFNALLLLTMVNQSCSEEKKCLCPISKLTTQESGISIDSSNQTYSIASGLVLNIPNIKKLIKADVNLSGDLRNSDLQVEKTYWEILGGNPEVTQHANIFWTTACAMYEIICEDPTISEKEKEAEKRQIVREYDAKIGKIIEGAFYKPATIEDLPQTLPKQKKETITFKEPNAAKVIQVKLVVDANFSDADFFVNGEVINPLPSSTLIVKEFEIDYKEGNLTLIAKSGKQECRKSFQIPNNYFDNPYSIQLICSI